MMFKKSYLFAVLALAFCACDNSTSNSDSDSDGGTSFCNENETRCHNNTPEICQNGRFMQGEPCGENSICENGACRPKQICEPSESRCISNKLLEQCSSDGTHFDQIPCEEQCSAYGSIAVCGQLTCIPGERTCNGSEIVVKCRDDGSQFDFVERCNGAQTGQECDRGTCVPLCEINEKLRTNVGCDYWAVDLDNAFVPGGYDYLDASAEQFAVVVSNPHSTFTAEVTILDIDGEVMSALVPPLGLKIFNLPRKDVDGTVQGYLSYRVRSSIPIVAYQFNPLDNEDVFSNDASLLLPSHVLGERYLVMTREQSFDNLRGYVTVVGIEEEPTQVTITVSAQTQPSETIPLLHPGESYTTLLHQYELINIETGAPGADLTGTLVESSAPVVVFGGNEAGNAPNTNHCIGIDPDRGFGVCEYDPTVRCENNYTCNDAGFNTCCADHLEQQLFPIETWGTRYVATKSFDRGLEDDYWRILAAEDGTKIETNPVQAAIPVLNAGEWFEFGSREHFEIRANKPILVGQFLAGEQAPNPNLQSEIEPGDAGTGDPTFILAVPVEQFRKEFVFLAPDKYAYDYVNIIAPVTANVVFDESSFSALWEPVGDTGWQTARFPISDGTHFLEASEPIAVVVYGYDQYVSYGYPGGLNLDVVDAAEIEMKEK